MHEIAFESTRRVTQKQFARWVKERQKWDPHHYELLDGKIVMNPPAGFPHGPVGSKIQFVLESAARMRNLGVVCDSSQGFELPSGDTVEPDHSFVSWERWRTMPSPEEGEFLKVVPDLIVEVLSPSTSSRDRTRKKDIYERNGVREYWLVDTRARTVTVFELKRRKFGRGRRHGEKARFRSPVLGGHEVEVGALFAVLPPRH